MGNSKPCILAVDLGTTGPRVCVSSVQGEVLAFESMDCTTYYREDGGVEQDPNEWWILIKECIHKILKDHPSLASRIIAVSCCAQWSGTVPVHNKGEALGYAITGMDARGADQIKEQFSGILGKEFSFSKRMQWKRKVGLVPGRSGTDPLSHILFLKEKKSYVYAKTYKFLEPKDYLNLKFTGKYAASYDSIALHWVTDNRDLKQVHYDKKLLHIAEIEKSKLPDLYKSTDLLGPIKAELAKELGLSPHVQVIVGSPNVQTAALGSGAVDFYNVHLNLGNVSWLSCHLPRRKTDTAHQLGTVPSSLSDRYLLISEPKSAIFCLKYLWETFKGVYKDIEGNLPSFERLDKLARHSVPGSRKVLFTPWMNAQTTTDGIDPIRGSFHNLSLQNKASDIVHSAYEGVAFNSRAQLEALEKLIKQKTSFIPIVGMGAESDLWCQIHADILNRKVLQVVEPDHASLRGAAWLGSLAMGYMSAEDIPSKVKVKKEYNPSPEEEKFYSESFQEFLTLYRSNKKIYNV